MSWNAMLMAMSMLSDRSSDGADAEVVEVTEVDASVIRDVIRAQIAAFRDRDAATAFALATPDLQDSFGTATRLLSVVLAEAPSLASPRMVLFGDIVLTTDGLAQRVQLVARDGLAHDALYLVERIDEDWRVAGCLVGAVPEEAMAA